MNACWRQTAQAGGDAAESGAAGELSVLGVATLPPEFPSQVYVFPGITPDRWTGMLAGSERFAAGTGRSNTGKICTGSSVESTGERQAPSGIAGLLR
jgi:hypothetical protein